MGAASRHRPFAVGVTSLLRNPGERLQERRQGVIPGLAVSTSRVPDGAEVEVEVGIEAAHPGVLVTGTVRTRWAGECRRCLAEVQGELSAEVRELFESEPDPETTYRLSGEQVDLEQMAHDAVILALPLAPLCRPDCAGLCPRCGADLNAGPCDCPREPC